MTRSTTTSAMNRVVDAKDLPTIADLPVCCHTTRYERFFLLSLDLRVNGEKTKLSGVNSKRVCLSAFQQSSWQVSSENLLNAANVAGKKYGISRVARLCCGRLPMMEVDFSDRNEIAIFLDSLRDCKFQMSLERELGSLSLSHFYSRTAPLYLPCPAMHHLSNQTYCIHIIEHLLYVNV